MPICFAIGRSIGLKPCNLCLRKGLRTFLLSFLFLLHVILLLLAMYIYLKPILILYLWKEASLNLLYWESCS